MELVVEPDELVKQLQIDLEVQIDWEYEIFDLIRSLKGTVDHWDDIEEDWKEIGLRNIIEGHGGSTVALNSWSPDCVVWGLGEEDRLAAGLKVLKLKLQPEEWLIREPRAITAVKI